ncbi:DUF3187 family protein [Steroidobacter denitrificans]|nr:DUF3187 family protein [Steroidobacter denitrificans]
MIQAPAFAAGGDGYFGLLRARDLTPFGYLRLDMRPAYAGSLAPGSWAMEAELAYQNTWALSPEVERYLVGLPGRRTLGPAEYQAMLDLPGDNYLVDQELAQLDVTLHYQFTADWSAYLILSGAAYGGGFLDSAIEGFHDTFGFSSFGRHAVSRNDANILLNLKSTQYVSSGMPTSGGLLDPTIGVRYSGVSLPEKWKLILEAAAKLPLNGHRTILSTGRTDVGVQAAVQRFSKSQAIYVNAAAVYYAGAGGFMPSDAQIVPTLVLGYERRLTQRTNAILQGYISPSVYDRNETDLYELLATKYQLSLGFFHRRGRHAFRFAITENLQNLNNTPDIGFQLGWTFSPERSVD